MTRKRKTNNNTSVRAKKARITFEKGGRFDPEFDQLDLVEEKLSKKCKCHRDCIGNLKEFLMNSDDGDRIKRFETIYKNFSCGTRLNRADHIYNHLLATMNQDKINYTVMNMKMCRESFAILFCSNNFLSKRIMPALNKRIKPSEFRKDNDNDNEENNNETDPMNNCNNRTWFENRPTRKHFDSFFKTIEEDNLLESSPIDGSKWLPTCIDTDGLYNSYLQDCIDAQISSPYGRKQFFILWDQLYPEIKCREDTMRCDTCDSLETKICACNDQEKKRKLLKKKKQHLSDIQESRRFHDHCKIEAARGKAILLLGDGGDRFGLPRKKVTPKSLLTKTTLPVGSYMIDVYNSSLVKQSHGYYYTDYNTRLALLPGICIESINRTLDVYGLYEGKLKEKTLYLCTDNTSKEGKNYFMLGYLHSLVSRSLVRDVTFYNLHVGHTHFEADQSIGIDKRYLRKRALSTLPQVVEILNSRKNKNYTAIELNSCKDWRSVISKCYRKLTGIQKNGWKCFHITNDGVQGREGYEGDYTGRIRQIKKRDVPEEVVLDPEECSNEEIDQRVIDNIPTYKQHIPDAYHSWWDKLIELNNEILISHEERTSDENIADEASDDEADANITNGADDDETLVSSEPVSISNSNPFEEESISLLNSVVATNSQRRSERVRKIPLYLRSGFIL